MTHPATAAHTPLRVSDLEREHTAGLLQDHLIAGRLDLAEFEERLEQSWRARFVDDLWDALRELPGPHARPVPPALHLAPAPPPTPVTTAPLYLPPARAAPCLAPVVSTPATTELHEGGVFALVLGCVGACLLVLSLGLLWPLALCLLAPAWAVGRSARHRGDKARGQALMGEILGTVGTGACLLMLAGCAALIA